jgi:hypothetical protein
VLLVVVMMAAMGVGQARVVSAADAEQEIVRLVNRERHSRGLATLATDEKLREAAREHSQRMASAGAVEHQFAGEAKLEVRLEERGLRFDVSGENVALAGDAAEVHMALMHSPGHRANILDGEYRSIGVGVVRKGDGIYVTQDFAALLPEVSVAEAEDTVAASLNRMRRADGKPLLNRLPEPNLRREACEMASHDKLNASAGLSTPNASSSVAFTALDLTKMPASLERLKSHPASGFSVGACYQTSATFEVPVFWIVVVTYY